MTLPATCKFQSSHECLRQLLCNYMYVFLSLIINTVNTEENNNHGHQMAVSVSICSAEGNLAGIFVSKVSPGILVIKEK